MISDLSKDLKIEILKLGICFVMTNNSEGLTYIGSPSQGRGDSKIIVSLKHSVVSQEQQFHLECPLRSISAVPLTPSSGDKMVRG